MDAPLPFRWTGEAMEPMSRFRREADARFVVGEHYRLVPIEERSQKSHSHYFAALHDLWMSIPERVAHDYPSVEHLRKRALVLTGHRNERAFVCASKAEAVRLAAFLRPAIEFAIVSVHEATVIEWTPKSQSLRAMGKQDFQRSKDDVLAFARELCGVTEEVAA